MDGPGEPVLEVKDLHVEFATRRGTVHAARGVDLTLHSGETLVLLGESGSGKSVTVSAVMGILDSPPASVTRGSIDYRGRDLLTVSSRERRRLVGDRISLVFQDALAALNPVFTIGWQISETIGVHRKRTTRRQRNETAVELLRKVAIPSPETRVDGYAHNFSGGMRQRAMIALGIALDPDVLIADEPTTALDVTVQAQIIQLLMDLQRDTGTSVIFITHDIGLAREIADSIAVMYAGRVVESGAADQVLATPSHPYTRALLRLARREGNLNQIPGAPPDLSDVPPGCAFHVRCEFARAVCHEVDPVLRVVDTGQRSACHFAGELRDGKVPQ